jgi:hypothetical protein
MSSTWRVVAAVGFAGAIGFAILAFIEDLGLLVQAVIPLVGAALTLRSRLSGVIVIGAFCLLEVVFVPFYDRETTLDWVAQASAWIVGVVGLVAVARVFLERRRVAAPPG